MATTLVSSAGGMLAMLNESHLSLKLHALSNLNNLVDTFWPEISTSVPLMYARILLFPLDLCVSVSELVFLRFGVLRVIWDETSLISIAIPF